MSGQDEKLDIIDRARRKYEALTNLLQRGNNPSLPKELAKVIGDYKILGAVINSIDFEDALKKYWKGISVPSDLRSKLELIANERGPSLFEEDFFGYWERWNESLK